MKLKIGILHYEKVSSMIKGKEVKLILGGPGVGKSTTICYLGGCKMDQPIINGRRYPYYIPVDIEQQIRRNPTLGELTRIFSRIQESNHIIPVEINLQCLGFISEGKHILVEIPGDSKYFAREVEEGILREFSTINAISQASSLQFIFVFSQRAIGNNLEGLADTAKNIVNMFKMDTDQWKIDRLYNTFTYLFTRYPDEMDPKTLFNEIVDKYDNLNEVDKSNKPFMQLLEHIIDQAECHDGIKLVFPGKPEEVRPLWNLIRRKQNIKNP